MGVSLHCLPIHPQSALYRHLHEDAATNLLLTSVFPYGSNPYAEIRKAGKDIPNVVEDVLFSRANVTIFGSEAEARERYSDFRQLVESLCAQFPGIDRRHASLEKCIPDVQERLTLKLAEVRADAGCFVEKLMFGDRPNAPHLLPAGCDPLWLVPSAVIQEGAKVLLSVPPTSLFTEDDGWEGWCFDQYREWRELCLGAAERGEEILTGLV